MSWNHIHRFLRFTVTNHLTCLCIIFTGGGGNNRYNGSQDAYRCRIRLQAYVTNCAYDYRSGGCPMGVAKCRNAQVEIQGTVLTTNCTCSLEDPAQLRDCLYARSKIQIYNPCTGGRVLNTKIFGKVIFTNQALKLPLYGSTYYLALAKRGWEK